MSEKKIPDEANRYDKIFKENLEEVVLPMLNRYWDVEVKKIRMLRNKVQTTTEREADFLSEITDTQNNRFILHVEFQSQDDSEMIYPLQEYHGMISRKYKLPIRHFVFYFGDRPSKMKGTMPEKHSFQGFTLLDFKTIDYQDLLSSDTGNEIVLAILADFKDRQPEAILRLIIQRLSDVSKNKNELQKYFNQLNVLSRLRKLDNETIKIISGMPIYIDIEKDQLYNKGIEKGKQETEVRKNREATIKMLQLGSEISFICEVLNVTEAYVLEIKKELEG